MTLRKSVAAALLAGAAVFSVAACSSDDDTTSTTTTSASASASAEASTSGEAQATDLDVASAQTILRTALNPDTSSEQLDTVVDTSNPATKPALQAYNKGASAAGYGPEVYEVKTVKADGDKATVTVAVTSPHAPDHPVDLDLTYVNIDGTWKLSGSVVEQLSSMMPGGH
ncbi:DUF4878 domain-containing protein [Gordonia desulfuricans]|uniref:DUF4878 domain-containing protein n=1 Tax=Gordonia desulfuricans TaxID=89051 RepID=A0A7K3LN58_9ACTN|nr:hypothetical protein [Gordonia desulfuricans]NDK89694.1 DUF4878 domain-containing protein [Gordonia desulfuricans]